MAPESSATSHHLGYKAEATINTSFDPGFFLIIPEFLAINKKLVEPGSNWYLSLQGLFPAALLFGPFRNI